jgi:hypothetical protein
MDEQSDRAARWRRLDGVLQQVVDDLPNALLCSMRGNRVGDIHGEPEAALSSERRPRSATLAGKALEVDPARWRRARTAARQPKQAFDELTEPLDFA